MDRRVLVDVVGRCCIALGMGILERMVEGVVCEGDGLGWEWNGDGEE